MRKGTIFLAAAIGGVLLAGCGTPQPKSYQPTQTYKAQRPIEAPKSVPKTRVEIDQDGELARQTMTAVRDQLKDPESASFSGLYAVQTSTGSSPIAVCGLVNAKNSYGGYVGKTLFGHILNSSIVKLWNHAGGLSSSIDNEMVTLICKTD